jgi:hypothetical protein
MTVFVGPDTSAGEPPPPGALLVFSRDEAERSAQPMLTSRGDGRFQMKGLAAL